MRRLTILLAMVGALLLLPVAQALAASEGIVSIEGTGSGTVIGGMKALNFETEEYETVFTGTPPIECSYTSPGPATGNCTGSITATTPFEELYLEAYGYGGGGGLGLKHPAAPGSEFAGWTITQGTPLTACGPSEKECLIFTGEGENIEVTATFNDEPGEPLIVNIEEGSGTVVSNPAGLECSGTAPEACGKSYEESGSVTLTASPAPGYLFKGWKGCDSGGVNGRQCTMTVGTAKTVGAKFVKVFSLEGSKSGGPGIMSTSPGGINCGYACSSSTALYKEGSLTVKAKAAKHFHLVEFTNGTGSAASCNGVETESCTFTITANSAVEELYAEDAKSTLSLSKEGGGQGFVKTSPTNINCGYTCTEAVASFYASESAAVTVTLGKGTSSVTWVSGAGTCTGSALTCSVPMSESHSLVAKFN